MKQGAIFNKVLINLPKRNTFDLSHDRKFSAKMGLLYPILMEEVYPNESWNVDGQSLVRTAPMVAPMMHTVNIYKHYFFIPNRILWPNWDLFITGGDKFNAAAPIPVPPYIKIPNGGFAVGSLADHLGFPTGTGDGQHVSAFPFAAYLRTHMEYYRDENLMNVELVMLTDGDNTANLAEVVDSMPLPRSWERDYFTSCLPFPQKGPEVSIPLGSEAPIMFREESNGRTYTRKASDDSPYGQPNQPLVSEDLQGRIQMEDDTEVNIDISTTHYVDLSDATSATINDLRLSFAIQKFYERLSRGGTRAIEFLRAVWGAKASSSRLDRPEYFGGAKEALSISEVLQQSQTSEESPQGNMSGHGVAVTRINGCHYNSSEYGVILGLFSVMPKTAYQQGVRKQWLRLTDRFDYYFPDLANIGEQPVLNGEIFFTPNDVDNKKTFGYLPYGTELRYINDSVHGEFKTTQDHWHMGRIFANPPQLNEDFIYCDPTRRVFADTSEETDTLYCHIYHKIYAKRSIPIFGTPGGL